MLRRSPVVFAAVVLAAVVVAAAVVAAAVLAACSGDDASPPTTTDPPTTTTASPTTTPPPSQEEAVLAAVDGYWRTIREANADPPNPDHPGFDEFFTGEARSTSLEVTRGQVVLGHGVRLPGEPMYRHDPVVVEIDASTALVHDCALDDSVLFDLRTGEILDDEVATYLWEMLLVFEDGRWAVSRNVVVDEWEGEAGCALEF